MLISLVPYMVYKIRNGLQQAMETPTSSWYIKNIAAEIKLIFNTHSGEGGAGTVATENLQPGFRRRPKGINMLALMASFLDPRMKGHRGWWTGPGFGLGPVGLVPVQTGPGRNP
jgi:hypothetical protein